MMGEWLISDFEKQIYFQRKDKTEHVISRLGWGAKNQILPHCRHASLIFLGFSKLWNGEYYIGCNEGDSDPDYVPNELRLSYDVF